MTLQATVHTDTLPFSTALREGTMSAHVQAERSSLMERLVAQQATLEEYTALTGQLYFLYTALEDAAASLISQYPEGVLAELHSKDLSRVPALEQDLAFLLGPDWRESITPLPATAEYASRITELAEEGWEAGYVVHHYTRYLGDISGGQVIGKRIADQHGFTDDGVRFYNFKHLGSPSKFKTAYRGQLDALGEQLSEEERERAIVEAQRAFAHNTAMFADISES